jgi:UV DNA damage endonuclease
MSKNRLGYCCINLTLGEQGITTNRGMVKKTFLDKGLPYVSELSLKNAQDLVKIIEWNNTNGIRMYRMSSDIFPWCSEYEFSDLPDYEEIKKVLEEAGKKAIDGGQRIAFHPSPYSVLASQNPSVVKNAIKELRQHAEIMDLMNFPKSHFYPINIHVNTAKPSKQDAANRFCDSFDLLPDNVKKRLVVENDDKKSAFTPTDLYDLIYSRINIPITFDFHHFKCNPDSLTEEQALRLCLSTWGNEEGLTHYSDSRRLYEDSSAKDVAHSDWIYNKINTYDLDFSIELEVKMKEKALIKFLEIV